MGGPQRHHSVSEYDGLRSHSASNLQGYYASQRFAPRPNDADLKQYDKLVAEPYDPAWMKLGNIGDHVGCM